MNVMFKSNTSSQLENMVSPQSTAPMGTIGLPVYTSISGSAEPLISSIVMYLPTYLILTQEITVLTPLTSTPIG